jgi:DNA-binding IclR family transcriptional regulator
MNEDPTSARPPRQPSSKQNASVAKAAAVLRAAAVHRDGISVSALARAAGLPRATALRMIEALEAEGLLARLRDRDVVLLGTAVLDLARAVVPERLLVEAARTPLAELAHDTGELATLSVRHGEVIVGVHEVAGPRLIAAASWLGRSWPLHGTATGLLALARMDEAELAAQLSEPLSPFTEATITDPGAIRTRLPRVRDQGWAASLDELEIGLTSVAAPVRGIGIDAYVAVSGPTFRFGAEQIELAAASVQTAAAAVVAALHDRRSVAGRRGRHRASPTH